MRAITPEVLAQFPEFQQTLTTTEPGASVQLETGEAVPYLFGHSPLVQLLAEVEPGRLQVYAPALNTQTRTWFDVFDDVSGPQDVLHWRQPGQNWNFMCADCHSTGVQKGWQIDTRRYETQFAEISVGCEACHGPGSNHEQWAAQDTQTGTQAALPDTGDTYIVTLQQGPEQIEVCATCHSRRQQHAQGYRAGAPWLDYYQPELLREGLYHADGQVDDEVYVYGSFLQSRMHLKGVTCGDCHNPHSAGVELAGDAVCTQCHNPAGNPRFPSLVLATYDSPSHSFHDDVSCVDCHMTGKHFMQVDFRRDHSFRVPRPDLTLTLGAPNACDNCHEQGAEWAAEVLASKFGTPPPHYGSALRLARTGDARAERTLTQLAQDAAETPLMVRASALAGLSSYANFGSASVIREHLSADEGLLQLGAIEGARRWAGPQRFAALEPLLDDKLLAVRVSAVQALLEVYADLSAPMQARLQQAAEVYQEVLLFNADRAEGLAQAAWVNSTLGKLAAAEDLLRQAVAMNPLYQPAWLSLADVLHKLQRDAEAGAPLDAALAIASQAENLAQVLAAKAMWLVRQQRHPEALPLLRQAYATDSTEQQAYMLAVAEHSLGDSAAALDLLLAHLRDVGPSAQLQNLAFSIARDTDQTDRMLEFMGLPTQSGEASP